MPLYEYACPACGEKREILARSAEAAVAPACPVCAAPMQKEWAPVACHAKAGAGGGACAGGARGHFS